MADAIVMQRYIEISGSFERVMSVVKVRASAHSRALRLYDIRDDGIFIGAALQFEGTLSGHPSFAMVGQADGGR